MGQTSIITSALEANNCSKEVDKLQPIYYNMFVGAYVEAYIKTSCLMKGDSND